MSMRANYRLALFTLITLCLFMTTNSYGQSTVQSHFTAQMAITTENNNGETAAAPAAAPAPTPSPAEMSEQIRSQQLEIDELRAHIRKLEAAVNAVTKTTTNSVTAASTNLATSAPNTNTVTPAPVSPPMPRPLDRKTPSELLPELGHIGAQIGLLVGGSTNPFQSNEGFFAGGFIDLPLKKVKGGKISYEIMISAQRTLSTQQTTSGVTALVNSAINSALGNPASVNNLLGPLPVTNKVQERLTVLTVVPASFKYTMMTMDRQNFRPYFVVGLGTYVGLSSQKLVDFDAAKYINNPQVASLINALLNGAQVGGLAPIAPELRARGLSAGQGDLRFGLNAGGGVEFRVSPRFSLGFDYRINKVEGRNGTFSTFAAKPTIHF